MHKIYSLCINKKLTIKKKNEALPPLGRISFFKHIFHGLKHSLEQESEYSANPVEFSTCNSQSPRSLWAAPWCSSSSSPHLSCSYLCSIQGPHGSQVHVLAVIYTIPAEAPGCYHWLFRTGAPAGPGRSTVVNRSTAQLHPLPTWGLDISPLKTCFCSTQISDPTGPVTGPITHLPISKGQQANSVGVSSPIHNYRNHTGVVTELKPTCSGK